jgi:predicted  nucleic acid-binding Zn-ribbon protein
MPSQKGGVAKQDLKGFKEEIVHQFHVISEGVIDQVKQVAEGVSNVDEKLDRRFNELKAEIQETRQEILAAVKFSYAELDKRLTTLEKEFIELKHRVEKIETRSIS